MNDWADAFMLVGIAWAAAWALSQSCKYDHSNPEYKQDEPYQSGPHFTTITSTPVKRKRKKDKNA